VVAEEAGEAHIELARILVSVGRVCPTLAKPILR
jgi:hypothetical protein